jgi:hypothetical protein
MSASPIRQIEVELYEMAEAYAAKAEAFATDPYFKDAVMKAAVSNFVWALYHAFGDRDGGRYLDVLYDELTEQRAAVGRSLEPKRND